MKVNSYKIVALRHNFHLIKQPEAFRILTPVIVCLNLCKAIKSLPRPPMLDGRENDGSWLREGDRMGHWGGLEFGGTGLGPSIASGSTINFDEKVRVKVKFGDRIDYFDF